MIPLDLADIGKENVIKKIGGISGFPDGYGTGMARRIMI